MLLLLLLFWVCSRTNRIPQFLSSFIVLGPFPHARLYTYTSRLLFSQVCCLCSKVFIVLPSSHCVRQPFTGPDVWLASASTILPNAATIPGHTALGSVLNFYVHIGSCCYHTGAADTHIACAVCIAPFSTTTAQRDNSCNVSPISFSLLSHRLHSPCPSPLSAISLGHSLSGHTFSVWIVNLTAYLQYLPHSRFWDSNLGAATFWQPWQTQLQRCRWKLTTSPLHRDGNPGYIAISSGGSWNACACGTG